MFNALDSVQQVFWGCALIGTLVFAIQMVLTLIGMDSSDIDVDFDGADTMDLGGGLSLFSIKNFINFLVGFGWAGISLNETISNTPLLIFFSFLVGVAFILMFFFIKKQTKKLEHNGAFNISDCVGKQVDVYLRIPSHRSGKGKVQVSLNGAIQEFEALTDGGELKSGCKAQVVDIIEHSTLLVK